LPPRKEYKKVRAKIPIAVEKLEQLDVPLSHKSFLQASISRNNGDRIVMTLFGPRRHMRMLTLFECF
jgi:hypothetical protein